MAEQYRESLTARGRYLLWTTAGLALMGLNTKENQVFKVFAVTGAMLFVAFLFAAWRAPRVDCRLPARATDGRPIAVHTRLRRDAANLLRPLLLSFPKPLRWASSVRVEPRQVLLPAGSEKALEATVTLEVERRGRYVLRGPTLRATDPLGLVGSRARRLSDHILLVYPRFYSMESFRLPLGRRYRPGGIPLASNTGDSLEFLGTREYRRGDPVKHIHWRSWARVGKPVVKEFQEEYFCRIALILDTFLPLRPKKEAIESFEAGISVLASIADYFSRSEYVVDIFAAGPDLYEVSAGRSLAYLENILDVLACLEPCHEPAFRVVGPTLFEKLSQTTSVVAVVQDWDDGREKFLKRVKSFGVELRIIVVREGATTRPWESVGDELGEISVRSR